MSYAWAFFIAIVVGAFIGAVCLSAKQMARDTAACEARTCPDGQVAKYHPNLSDCLCVTRPK